MAFSVSQSASALRSESGVVGTNLRTPASQPCPTASVGRQDTDSHISFFEHVLQVQCLPGFIFLQEIHYLKDRRAKAAGSASASKTPQDYISVALILNIP